LTKLTGRENIVDRQANYKWLYWMRLQGSALWKSQGCNSEQD
jgi:hypothetical protein